VVKLLIVGFGGFLGAIARHSLCAGVGRLHDGHLPLGTFAVNIIGCLAIGAAMAVAENRPVLSENARLLIVTGLLGAFTTFSTFGHETVDLLREGKLPLAGLYVFGSLALGGGAVILGRLATRAITA